MKRLHGFDVVDYFETREALLTGLVNTLLHASKLPNKVEEALLRNVEILASVVVALDKIGVQLATWADR